MKSPLKTSDLVRTAGSLELGLRAGRDWISILKWISMNDPKEDVRVYFRFLCHKLKFEAIENVLRSEKELSRDLTWILFIEILLQAHRGSQHLSQLFQTFSKTSYSIQQLKQKEISLLFVPRFQTWAALLLTVAFTIALPMLAPEYFPTFITLKRYDLFAAGFGYLGLGFCLLQWMCIRPRRHLRPMLNLTFFFYFLSLFIESGLDFSSAWYRAVGTVDFDHRIRSLLQKSGLNVETSEDFLKNLQSQLQAPWPEILNGLLWAKTSGVGLSNYLKSISEKEGERLTALWEDEIRKLTMTSLIPLGLVIFPATLFLLVGPQMLQLVAL
ncbi:MAG: hypothetical protein J0L93_02075 [Deltaproteobacteria bacterium]|nr:hypothetical protein [Deltaproteobacteria bacterium]